MSIFKEESLDDEKISSAISKKYNNICLTKGHDWIETLDIRELDMKTGNYHCSNCMISRPSKKEK